MPASAVSYASTAAAWASADFASTAAYAAFACAICAGVPRIGFGVAGLAAATPFARAAAARFAAFPTAANDGRKRAI